MSYITDNKELLTSSKLEAFAFCETFYLAKYELGLIDDKKTGPLDFGTCFDLFEQSPEKYQKFVDENMTNYYIGEKRSKAGKEEWEANEAAGKICVTPSEYQKALPDREKMEQMMKAFERQKLYQPVTNPQTKIIVDYKGIKLKATMDDFLPEKKLILDTKTSANMSTVRRFKLKYRNQMCFYQLCAQLDQDILCDAVLKIVTKEEISKTIFIHFTDQELLDHRQILVEMVGRYIEAKKSGKYRHSDYLKCLDCDAYEKCPYAIQDDYFSFDMI